MSSELERRVTEAFRKLPGATTEIEARARAAALAALVPPASGRGVRRRLLVVALAGIGLLALAAAALAAIGTLHVRLGTTKKPARAASAQLMLPAGANGFAVLASGKLALVTRGGFRLEGLPVTAAALSPRARYVAVGLRRTLAALAPDGKQMWVHETRGRVVGAAWAPSGLEIAYVVARHGRAAELRMIEGDGDHDRLVDPAVAPVRPAWRAD